MFYYMDSTWLLILPGLLLSMLASTWVRGTYEKYAKVRASRGITAADMAREMLRYGGAADVQVERVPGQLTDNYDPRSRVLRLSDGVYDSTSIAALGIAAHETGHALQHQHAYAPLALRSFLVPAVQVTSQAAMPLFIAGLIFSWPPLLTVGIVCFAVAVFFSLVTLPVEFNASARALAALEGGGYLTREENGLAAKVLRAASMTYVASALMALGQLVRLLLLSEGRRNRR
ncbi:MAG: zinc metallopeptidase [Oscillospiraceae bacterium]|jgi:Zn-dependent membrane protease YugP|nr:zinc metallopeptidase [Oscillospiraceae bacterium]